MSESFWDGGENREAERLPQADCVLVGFDDSVELHRRVPIRRRHFEDTLGQGTSYSPAGCSGRHHETRVGDMTASSWLILMKLGGSHHGTILNGHEYAAAGFAHPPHLCRVFAGVGWPAVGFAGGNDRLQESPDGGPIRVDGIADLHFGILTVVPGR
jgi:hypothetical protein